jgi:exosortase
MNRRNIIILAAAALLLCYASTLRIMMDLWWNDEDLGHCFVVPFVVLWIIWRERDQWRRVPVEPSRWGFAILAVAAVMHVMAVMGVGPFTASVAFLLSIVGAVLALGGFGILRAWAFPLLMMAFMLPKLVLVYNQVTLPMQLLATRLAVGMLALIRVVATHEGNVLNVTGHQVAVVEACNGMRYLLALAFLSQVFAYLAGARPWVRVALLAASVPIAILGNALRVAAAGYAPSLDAGTPHAVAGWVIFVLCVGSLAALRRLLGSIPVGRHA